MQLGHIFPPFGDAFGLNKFIGRSEVACYTQPGSGVCGFKYFTEQGIIAEGCFDKKLGLVVALSDAFQLFYLFASQQLINRKITMKDETLAIEPRCH